MLISLPVVVRHVDAAVRDALRSPFIQAARAHGISRHRILMAYVLPAAANPLISLLGYSIGGLLSSSLLVEVIMGWPGLGSLLLESIFSRDVHVVIGATLVSALFLITGNVMSDLLLYAADPRASCGAMTGGKAAIACGVLALIHGLALLAGFAAPYPAAMQQRDFAFAPPTSVHWMDRDSHFHWRPFVYGSNGMDESRMYPFDFSYKGIRIDWPVCFRSIAMFSG